MSSVVLSSLWKSAAGIFEKIDRSILQLFDSLLPFTKVEAKRDEETTPIYLTSLPKSQQNELMEFSGSQDLVDFSTEDVTFEQSDPDGNFPTSEIDPKTGVELRFDLSQDSEAENEDDTTPWSRYQNLHDILKNTCKDILYDLDVDPKGVMTFMNKNRSSLNMYEDEDSKPFNNTVRLQPTSFLSHSLNRL
jgi:hypothetical protein